MIKSMKIVNFQSHKKTILHFNPGLNVLFGDTDQGKSSVVRAFRWVAKNRPVGAQAYRPTFAKDDEPTEVTIVCHNGTVIKRFHKGTTTYKVKTTGKKTTSMGFQGFGTKIPQQVEDLLNLDAINIQEQFDLPFLTGDSSGAVSRELNRVAHLDIIDTTLANLQSSYRKTVAQIKTAEQEIEEYDDYIKKLTPYRQLLDDARELKSKYEKFAKINSKIKELEGYYEQLLKIDLELEAMPNVDELNQVLKTLSYDLKVIQELNESIDELQSLYNNLSKKQSEIKTIDSKLTELKDKLPKECPTCGSLLK